MVSCNRHVQSRIKEVELIWDAGFPVHAVQLVKVQGGTPPKHRVWKAGRQYGEEVLPNKEHQGLASNLLRSTKNDWDKACNTGVNAMWSIIELVAHEFHSLVAGNGVPEDLPGRYGKMRSPPK